MGSRRKNYIAYIAGFLDGDGSLMLQIKKRSDSKIGIRFMSTICLYQDSRHEIDLRWIRTIFRIGYLSHRNDGISELRINGYKQVHDILVEMQPFIRFKRIQARALIKACKILMETSIKSLTKKQLQELIDLMLIIQNANYVTKKKKSKEELYELLRLTP